MVVARSPQMRANAGRSVVEGCHVLQPLVCGGEQPPQCSAALVQLRLPRNGAPHHLLHPPTRKETTCCSLQVDGPTPPYRTPGGCAPPQGPRAVVGAGAGGTAVVIGVVDE